MLLPALSSNLLLNYFINDICDLNSFELQQFELNIQEISFRETLYNLADLFNY